jgi:hypothetical protein
VQGVLAHRHVGQRPRAHDADMQRYKRVQANRLGKLPDCCAAASCVSLLNESVQQQTLRHWCCLLWLNMAC